MIEGSKLIGITGAAGFIGRRLATMLKELDVIVLGVDTIAPDGLPFPIYKCDLANKAPSILKDCDIVFHLAAIASPKFCAEHSDEAYEVNVNGTRRVIEQCKPDTRFVFMSGAIVYGEQKIPLDESCPTLGRDVYSCTKLMGESLTWFGAANRTLNATVVRNFTTYGPGQSTDYVIPSLIQKGLNHKAINYEGGQASRDFTYIDDTVDALIKIACTESLIGETVNLGSGRSTPITDMAVKIAGQLDVPLTVGKNAYKQTGSSYQSCNNTKLMAATGWTPTIDLSTGIERTIQWIRSQQEFSAADRVVG